MRTNGILTRFFDLSLGLYGLVAVPLFLSLADRVLNMEGIIPVPPTMLALASLAPLVVLLFLQDFSTRRPSTILRILKAQALPLSMFGSVAFFSLLLAALPGAFWSEGARFIFLITYGFALTLLACFLPLFSPFRRVMPWSFVIGLAVLLGSIIYDVNYPGTFSSEPTRAAGFPGNSNYAALVTVMICAAALDYSKSRPAWIDSLIILMGFIAITLTMSRSGLINFAFLMAIYGYHRFIRGGIKLKSIISMILTSVFLVGAITVTVLVLMQTTALFKSNTRLGSLLANDQVDDGSAGSRLAAAEDSLRLINDSPVLGHGTGYSRRMRELPHNLYLQQWVNNGLPGILSYLGMLIASLWTFSKRRFYKGQAFIAVIALGSLFSHNVLEQRPFLILFGILLTLSWQEVTERNRQAAAYHAYIHEQRLRAAQQNSLANFDGVRVPG